MDAKFKERYDQVARFRAEMCAKCETEDDAIMVASLLMDQARVIFEELGGMKLAAAQFYGAADRFATEA